MCIIVRLFVAYEGLGTSAQRLLVYRCNLPGEGHANPTDRENFALCLCTYPCAQLALGLALVWLVCMLEQRGTAHERPRMLAHARV